MGRVDEEDVVCLQLGERGDAEVLGAGADVVEDVRRVRPDAVVLDLESRALGVRIQEASPGTTVVFWTRDEEVIEVVAPGASEPRRVVTPVPEELRSELMRSQVNRVER